MRFKDVFAIIGPSMIGPSSSHTAGAVRLGRAARQTLGTAPSQADIHLYGSFADTYRGHGTDLALVAGLLDFDTDDERIRDALMHADAAGIDIRFHVERKREAHPNTASILLRRDEHNVRVTGRSIGGGNIEIVGIDHFDVRFTTNYPTLLVLHADRSGMIAEITAILSQAQVNIGHMGVDRNFRNGEALTTIECDQTLSPALLASIGQLDSVLQLRMIHLSSYTNDKKG